MKDTKLQSIFEVLSTQGTFLCFLFVCVLSFWHISPLYVERLVELDKYFEKTKKERNKNQKEKKTKEQTTIRLTIVFPFRDVKAEIFQEA